MANVLFPSNSDYGKPSGKPPLSISVWAQYVLDNFATVAEAVDSLQQEPFAIVAPTLNGMVAQLHLSISDPTGDSAIFEYVDGKLQIHDGKEFQVMTNEPPFDKQLALNAYWQDVGGNVFLPGTIKPEDRFVRTSFFINAIPKRADPAFINSVPEQSYANQAVISVAGVMRGVSVPLSIAEPGETWAAGTIWRTVSDQKNLVYFFDSGTSPNTFWVPLSELDLGNGAPVKKLTVEGGRIYAGDAAPMFEPAEPFAYLPA